MTKVIIADSNELLRVGLKAVLLEHTNAQVIAEAETSKELVKLVAIYQPDVVLIDYTAEGFSVDVVAAIRGAHSKVRFVAITYLQSAHTFVTALKAGVSSYVKKDCSIEEICDSVTETAAGKRFFCARIIETIRIESIDVTSPDYRPANCEGVSLSDRELEIIALIAEGHTNGQVADKLFLSTHTVNTHRKNIMGKLGVNNTAGIVMYAVKYDLVSPNRFLFAGEA